MASADFLTKLSFIRTSPGKSIFLHPITAWSTILVLIPYGTFWTSQWCACLSDLIASYQVPVRQYRDLPVGFLHCIPYGKPACRLLTVQGVTPACKGLTPSGIISCYTFTFNNKNLYFQHFFRVSVKCAHAHAGHTQIVNCIAGFVVCRTLDSRNIVPFCRTGTSSEIRNDNLQVTVRLSKNLTINCWKLKHILTLLKDNHL